MSNNTYPDSPWYRTGDIRIVPWYFGLMQAQEQWKRDSYDSYGEVTGYNLEWRRVEKLPQEVSDNMYSYLAIQDRNSNPWGYKWKRLMFLFRGTGISDNVPKSPRELIDSDRKRWEEKQKNHSEDE